MTMKSTLQVALLSALAFAGISSAADPVPASRITRTSDCLVPSRVIAWGVVDDRRLVVKSLGQRYHDIQLSHACRDLSRRPFITFRDGSRFSGPGSARHSGRRAGAGDMRICGNIGDAIVPVSGARTGQEIPCDIRAMRRIDGALFDRVFELDAAAANKLLDAAPAFTPSAGE
jgi:hypothetical protein